MSLNPTPRRNRSWAVALVAAIAAMFLWVVMRPDPEPSIVETGAPVTESTVNEGGEVVTEPAPAPSN